MFGELTSMREPVITDTDLHRPLISALLRPDVQQRDVTHPFTRHGIAGADVPACLLTLQDRLLCSNTGICHRH